MNAFAYSSYKHQADQELLVRLGKAIFVLKLQAENRLSDYGFVEHDVINEYHDLARFLDALVKRTKLLVMAPVVEQVDMAFTGLSNRFVGINRADVPDRLEELTRLQARLIKEECVKERDFRLLDSLHALLEEETAEGVRGLYAI
jgi:hypothetical protein